jgi:hypothetical protein
MEEQAQKDRNEGEGRLGGKIGSWVAVIVFALLLNSCAWFLTDKTPVVVLDDTGGQLRQGEEYYTVGEGYLLGLPAAMLRLIGMEPPTRISGSGGTVEVAALGSPESGQDIILINPTSRDVWYTAEVYGDDSALSRGARTGTTKVPAGTGAVVVGKTHGELRFGCENRPLEYEMFSIGIGDSRELTLLSWIAEQHPESCGDGGVGK